MSPPEIGALKASTFQQRRKGKRSTPYCNGQRGRRAALAKTPLQAPPTVHPLSPSGSCHFTQASKTGTRAHVVKLIEEEERISDDDLA
jgi:hypothetical protein